MSPKLAHVGVTVLEVGDPALLRQIEALVDLDRYVLARISDTELVIDPALTGELAGRLEEHRLIPLVRRSR